MDLPANPDKRRNRLRAGLLLLLLPQREQTDTGDLDDLEAHTGDITLRLALATESSEQDLVVLVDEVQATVVGDCERGRNMSAQPFPMASSTLFLIILPGVYLA